MFNKQVRFHVKNKYSGRNERFALVSIHLHFIHSLQTLNDGGWDTPFNFAPGIPGSNGWYVKPLRLISRAVRFTL